MMPREFRRTLRAECGSRAVVSTEVDSHTGERMVCVTDGCGLGFRMHVRQVEKLRDALIDAVCAAGRMASRDDAERNGKGE